MGNSFSLYALGDGWRKTISSFFYRKTISFPSLVCAWNWKAETVRKWKLIMWTNVIWIFFLFSVKSVFRILCSDNKNCWNDIDQCSGNDNEREQLSSLHWSHFHMEISIIFSVFRNVDSKQIQDENLNWLMEKNFCILFFSRSSFFNLEIYLKSTTPQWKLHDALCQCVKPSKCEMQTSEIEANKRWIEAKIFYWLNFISCRLFVSFNGRKMVELAERNGHYRFRQMKC